MRSARRAQVVGHLRPDGDCVGSVLAAAGILSHLGVEVAMASDERVYPGYALIPGYERIERRPRPGWDSELTVYVDCGSAKRAYSDWTPAGPSINIDHHAGNPRFGTINWVDPTCAATCEMLFELAEAGGVPLAPIATPLLLGLLTDTGSFRYSNTGPRQMEIGAGLLRAGADLPLITRAAYETRSRESVALGSAVLAAAEYRAGGRLAWAEARLGLLARHGGNSNLPENLVSELRSIDGVAVSVFFVETNDGGLRASFRGDGSVDLNALASEFGGGGHRNASGATLPAGDYAGRRDAILARLERAVAS